jgi:hypothetical protein
MDTINVQGIMNSEVNKVSNVIIFQKANMKLSVQQQGPLTKAKIGSGAMEE